MFVFVFPVRCGQAGRSQAWCGEGERGKGRRRRSKEDRKLRTMKQRGDLFRIEIRYSKDGDMKYGIKCVEYIWSIDFPSHESIKLWLKVGIQCLLCRRGKFRTMKQDGMGFYIGRYWRCITPVCSKKLNLKILRKNFPSPRLSSSPLLPDSFPCSSTEGGCVWPNGRKWVGEQL